MPRSASEVEAEAYLRLLVLGPPKVGKTRTVIETCEAPAYVINCDDSSALLPAAKVCKSFEWDGVYGKQPFQEMENAIQVARDGVKAGKYKTIIWDTISAYAARIEPVLAAASDTTGKGPDGRRYWPEYEKRLRNVIERLFMLRAHVIVLSHYVDVGGEIGENQVEKTGRGIVPLLSGKARATIPMLIQDIVFLEKRPGNKRVFVTSVDGVFGPGMRNLEGHSEVEADVKKLWQLMKSETQPATKEKTKTK